MKPRIIILMHYLELGGAEMSLIGLLSALDPTRVDVDLFIYSHQGPLMEYIPKWVNLLPENKVYSMIERPMTEAIRNRQWRLVLARLLAKLKHRSYLKSISFSGDDGSIMQYIGDYVTPILPPINSDKEYDLCISFLTPHNIGRDKVKAKKKIAWIHTDYSTVHIDVQRELLVWGAYDNIISISREVTNAFVKVFPTLSSKIVEIENLLSLDFVSNRANTEYPTNFIGDIKLLSVGRFCSAKNYYNVPDICKRLRSYGVNATWYIIGYGGDEALIRSKITEAGMEKHVILLGKKENPYPYIKACDIYVQPSRYEGKSVTVREAQMLCTPIVVTAYPTAHSQINNGIDGVIVPLDNDGCAKGLADFIGNKTLQRSIVDHLASHDYSYKSEVEKIYSLLE